MKLAHAGMQHNLAFAAGFVLYGAVIANVIAHGVIWASDHKLKWSDLKQGRLYLVAFLLWAATAAFRWALQRLMAQRNSGLPPAISATG